MTAENVLQGDMIHLTKSLFHLCKPTSALGVGAVISRYLQDEHPIGLQFLDNLSASSCRIWLESQSHSHSSWGEPVSHLSVLTREIIAHIKKELSSAIRANHGYGVSLELLLETAEAKGVSYASGATNPANAYDSLAGYILEQELLEPSSSPIVEIAIMAMSCKNMSSYYALIASRLPYELATQVAAVLDIPVPGEALHMVNQASTCLALLSSQAQPECVHENAYAKLLAMSQHRSGFSQYTQVSSF